MKTTQLPADFPDVQGAIYGLALSLDAFLLNGIQYGLLRRVSPNGFLQNTASNLLRDLASLEEEAGRAVVTSRSKVAELLAALRAKCEQIVELVTRLGSFRALPLEELRTIVSRIPPLRAECVQLIQELEACCGTPKPFYQSRSAQSSASVNDFLTNLERVFTEEWSA
jgi:hypothetical protein